jgi:hypothetical protein
MTPYERVVAALNARKSRRLGDNWQCPSHDDRTPSLSVDTGTDRETGEPIVLIKCHAGCSTLTEILPALGIEPSELFSSGLRVGIQAELFPAHQFSPIGIDIVKMLPPSAHRNLWAATILGRKPRANGSRARAYDRRLIAAVIIEARHRKAVVTSLGISAPVLRNDIVLWREWGVAHRCSTKVLTIFIRKVSHCPICKASLTDDVSTPKASLTDDAFERSPVLTGAGFSKGSMGAPPDAVDEDPDQQVQEIAARSRKFEVYPELKALEESRRREDRRKAAGE